MTNEAFDREKQYHTMICISKKLLGKGLISEEELPEIEKMQFGKKELPEEEKEGAENE